MRHNQNSITTALKLAIGAVFAALVFVATYSLIIPIPATSGYFNLGETIIYVAAMMFGPFVGTLAGAGAAIADIMVPGAAAFAPGTLLIKSFEGATVGILYPRFQKYTMNRTLCAAASIIAGGSIMVSGYFLYEQIALGVPFLVALVEIPFNVVQMLIGLIASIPIVKVILRIYPQLESKVTTF